MRRATLTLALLTIAVFAFCVEPFVSGVTASQRTDGSQIIDIWYDVEDADSDTLTIVLEVSDDGGQTFAVDPDPSLLTGDVGEGIPPGTGKHIEWVIGAESVDYDSDSFVVKITAIEPTPPAPEGMVYVPAGSFMMGRIGVAEPVHSITLDAYYIGTYEVTCQQVIDVFNWAYGEGYLYCSIGTVSNSQGDIQELLDLDDANSAIGWDGTQLVFNSTTISPYTNCPCVEVSWYGAVAYTNFVSMMDSLSPCYDFTDWSCNWFADGYRLPTEAEWEYAARGASDTPDYTFAGSNDCDTVAWYLGNSQNCSHTVGQKNSSNIDTFDQTGNVFEWCWDIVGDYNQHTPINPHGPDNGDVRINRGGGWTTASIYSNVAYRNCAQPHRTEYDLGFRIARNAGPRGMVYVPAGTFQMGDTRGQGTADELPVHTVSLDSFCIGRYEVTHQDVVDVFNWANQQGLISCSGASVTNTQGDVRELLDLDHSACAIEWNGLELEFSASSYAISPQTPCITVSWYGAVAYCNYLSLYNNLTPAYDLTDWTCNWSADGNRLPTEAEWEYAARGACNQPDYLFAGSDNVDSVAWYSANSNGHTHLVGGLTGNALGVFDMSGNVFEWCWDWFDSSYYSASSLLNPVGPESGSARVRRGGDWDESAYMCRVWDRDSFQPQYGLWNTGFRLVRSASGGVENHVPEQPSNPTPADDAMGIELTPILQWSCSDVDGDSLTYDVYLGILEDLTDADIVATAISDTFFTASELEEGATYYWKIVVSDGTWINVSPVWSFTVGIEEMVYVPAGVFMMGDTSEEEIGSANERPVHSVYLDAFYIGTHEITNQQVINAYNWAYQQGYVNCSSYSVTNAQGNTQELLDLDEDCPLAWNGSVLHFVGSTCSSSVQCPSIGISWYGAVLYANFLSIQSGLTPCYDSSDWSCNWAADGYRLPTEAEWEYAARGATNTPDYAYAGSDTCDVVAWYSGNSNAQTQPVGLLQQNGLGTFDQSGNVWEWCWDRWDFYYYQSCYAQGTVYNPRGPETGDENVTRGGAWYYDTLWSRVSQRTHCHPIFGHYGIGFRLAKKAE